MRRQSLRSMCACAGFLPLFIATRARAVETVMVPTPDGIMLATDIYRADATPKPVLVFRTGNGKSAPVLVAVGNAAITAGDHDVVVQDIRGTGGSTGKNFITYSIANGEPLHEGDDGRTLFAYITRQPWSNGRVSMQGASHAGIIADLAAPGAGAALVGIYPAYATDDLRHQGLYQGGVLRMDIAGAVSPGPPTLLPPWETYATVASYIDDDAQIATVQAAGLHRGGWFDAFGQGTLDTFSKIQTGGGAGAKGRQKIVMGPWTHGGIGPTVGQLTFPPSAMIANSASPALEQAWLHGSFTGDWTAWDALPAVSVYLMGDASKPEGPGNVWQSFTAWPPPAPVLPLYFSDKGGLTGGTVASSSVSFESDPSNPCTTSGGTNNLATPGGPYDQRAVESRSDVAVFTSTVQQSPLTIIGRIHADVWITTNAPDVDVVVRMTDVYPDGRSMLMAQGLQRARYRNGLCPMLLTAGTATRIRVDMLSTALVVAPGHALRAIVSASASPLYAVNPQNGDNLVGGKTNQPAKIDVLLGGSTPSVLVLPVVGAKPDWDAGAGPSEATCPDASAPDASAAHDASAEDGSAEDASMEARDAAEADPAAEGGQSSPGGGCACNASAPAPLPSVEALLVLLAFRLRRRPGRAAKSSVPSLTRAPASRDGTACGAPPSRAKGRRARAPTGSGHRGSRRR